jgi:hypothetical protein
MQTLSTREVADRIGLSQDTVRWYERIGLLDRIPRGGDGRRRVNDLRAELDACSELLDTKISIYQSRVAAERS